MGQAGGRAEAGPYRWSLAEMGAMKLDRALCQFPEFVFIERGWVILLPSSRAFPLSGHRPRKEQYRTAYILEQMGFANTFDGIFSSAHIGYMKPQMAFFEHVIHKLEHIQAHEILFWDDRSDNIEAARQVGLQGELYTNFADFEQKMSCYLS